MRTPLGLSESDLKGLFTELCREEQRLAREIMGCAVLPDAGAPVHVRLDAIGREIAKIRSQVPPETVQGWLDEMHG